LMQSVVNVPGGSIERPVRGRRGFVWVPEGSAVGGRGETDLGREVFAQAGSVPEPGLLGDLVDGELRGLQEAPGEE